MACISKSLLSYKQKDEEVCWAKQNGPIDPSDAFNMHIKINNPPVDGLLFAY